MPLPLQTLTLPRARARQSAAETKRAKTGEHDDTSAAVEGVVRAAWEGTVLETLKEYISIPNQSPLFDPEYATNGYQEQVADLFVDWAKAHAPFAKVEKLQLEGRTPLIFLEIEATGGAAFEASPTCLMYGHADKQPPFLPWREGLGPWTPVVEDGKLYGRGGADDGYAMFGALTALKALREGGTPHARTVVLIEFAEESGSPGLMEYVEHLSDRIGDVGLVVCLDSGSGNYEQLWMTTTLRGMCVGTLKVEILKEGVHSGLSSGIVPSSFRILRHVLDRVEDSATGLVTEEAAAFLACDVPPQRSQQAAVAATFLGDAVHQSFPFVEGAGPHAVSNAELLLRRTWRPTISVTGAEGFPPLRSAGNVLRPFTSIKVSVRLPPAVDAKAAAAQLKALLERDAPHGANVSFNVDKFANGWDAPLLAPWLEKSAEDASQAYFKLPACYMGEGGSIPFMGMLGKRFPKAQFVVTGVLGPASNAHGPNEFLHLEHGTKLTMCVANICRDFGAHHVAAGAQ